MPDLCDPTVLTGFPEAHRRLARVALGTDAGAAPWASYAAARAGRPAASIIAAGLADVSELRLYEGYAAAVRAQRFPAGTP